MTRSVSFEITTAGLEPSPPRVVQQIRCQIHIRPLLFHRVELGNHRIGQRHSCAAFAAPASTRGPGIDPTGSVWGRPFVTG